MSIRNIFRHIGESLKSIKRNGWMTIASVSAVTVTLLLVGIFLAIILNINKLAQDMENDVRVTVYVDIGTPEEESDKLEEELNKLQNVKSAQFSSRDKELKKVVGNFGKEFNLFKGDDNPLYDVYVVEADAPKYTKKIAKDAAKIQNVYKADYGGTSTDRIFKLAKGVRTWGTLAAGLLLFVAVFLISNTIRITILSRSTEIEIMRLVGATKGFIRWPFFIEGAWIGALGSVIPILIMSLGYTKMHTILSPQLGGTYYQLLEPNEFVVTLNIVMLAIGVVIGSLGSVISMRRFLRI